MSDMTENKTDQSPCCGNGDYTLAFWVLRGWLALRAILTGVEKFGAYKTVQQPLLDRRPASRTPAARWWN